MIAVFVFLFGASIGSFLNAAMYRLRHSKSIVSDRSRCIHCSRVLAWFDLIPIVSFLVLRGCCRMCKKPIPKAYLAVELAAALLFVASFYLRMPTDLAVWTQPHLVLLLRDWLAIAVLLFLFAYDLRYMLLPDEVTLPAILVFALLSYVSGMEPLSLAIGIVLGGGFFLLQYLVSSGRWIGGGDIRFGALMGVLLGWPLILVGLFVSYIIGAVVAVVLIASGRKKLGQTIPFGTFLAVGTLVTLWFGKDLLAWYLGFL